MLAWDELHPYNAVHVIRIVGAVDVEQLRAVIDRTLAAAGLTHLALSPDRGTYVYHGGPVHCGIQLAPAGDGCPDPLPAEIERQLNTPFTEAERRNPFRFFVVPGDSFFWLGLAYFHAVADAEAIARLLLQIANGQRGIPAPNPAARLDLHPARHDRILQQSPGSLVRKLADLPAFLRIMRRSLRPPCRDAHDLRSAFTLFYLPTGSLPSLLATSRRLEVTLHDLFLAALLKALSPLAEHRRRTGRRCNVSVGTIVNLRKDLGRDSARCFGLFLGSFVVSHPVPAGMSTATLAREVRQQTCSIKRRRVYLGAPVELMVGRWMLKRLAPSRRHKFFQKHYPLWGGITNVNLNPLCKQVDGAAPADYFRAVSTGPVTPLVLSITTIGELINIGVTYRPAVYPPEEIRRLQERLLDAIEELNSPGDGPGPGTKRQES